MLNEIPAHGMYLAYPSGHLVPEAYASSNAYRHTFYFFYGRLLPNKESYDFLENIDDLLQMMFFLFIVPKLLITLHIILELLMVS